MAHPGPFAHLEDHVVIAPHQIRQDDHVAGIGPHVGKNAGGMGNAARHDGHADSLAIQGWVFLKQLGLPEAAQLRDAERGCVGQRFTRRNAVQQAP
jgi:hypothetical protein